MKRIALLFGFFLAGCVPYAPAIYNAPAVTTAGKQTIPAGPCRLALIKGRRVAVKFAAHYQHRELMLATIAGFIRLSGAIPAYTWGDERPPKADFVLIVWGGAEYEGSGANVSSTLHLIDKKGEDEADGVGEAILDQGSYYGYGYPTYSTGAYYGIGGYGQIYSSMTEAVLGSVNNALRNMCEGQKGVTTP